MSLTRRLLLFTLVAVWCTQITAAWPLTSQRQKEDGVGELYNSGLFEGDIRTTSEEIKEYYDGLDTEQSGHNMMVSIGNQSFMNM